MPGETPPVRLEPSPVICGTLTPASKLTKVIVYFVPPCAWVDVVTPTLEPPVRLDVAVIWFWLIPATFPPWKVKINGAYGVKSLETTTSNAPTLVNAVIALETSNAEQFYAKCDLV